MESKKTIIGDDGQKEWLCEHGIGHGNHVHTCDGCCTKKELPKKRQYTKQPNKTYGRPKKLADMGKVNPIVEEKKEEKGI